MLKYAKYMRGYIYKNIIKKYIGKKLSSCDLFLLYKSDILYPLYFY